MVIGADDPAFELGAEAGERGDVLGFRRGDEIADLVRVLGEIEELLGGLRRCTQGETVASVCPAPRCGAVWRP